MKFLFIAFYRAVTVLAGVALIALGSGCSKSPPEKEEVVWVNKSENLPQHTHHLKFDSRHLGHPVGVSVKLPKRYQQETRRYPVIYFLHGMGGNEVSDVAGFLEFLQPIIEQHNLPEPIVVFPNGGLSQYQGKVEPMIIEELIPYIDAHYRTIDRPQARILSGFSMGGAGAIRLPIRHPTLFGGAASWAGGMWHKDFKLLQDAATNAELLKANGFFALMINGEHDKPETFAALEKVFAEADVDHQRIVLPGLDHNFGLYLQQTGDRYGQFLHQLWSGQNF